MFISASAVRELQALRRKGGRPAVDPQHTVAGDNRLFVQQTATGYLCAGLGKSTGVLRFAFEDKGASNPMFDECRRIAKSIDAGNIRADQVLGLDIPPDEADDPHLRRLRIATTLLKFDPGEPRDTLGRWVARLGAAVAAAVGELVVPPAVAVGAAVAAGAAALLAPSGNTKFQQGTIEGRPDLTYRYDEHILTIIQADGSGNQRVLYRGSPGQDGYYRDDQGRIVGVDNGDTFAFDATLLGPTPATAGATAAVRAPTVEPIEGADPRSKPSNSADDDEPRVCPDPSKDRESGLSPRARAYQEQISKLKPGPDGELMAVELRGVMFDGCRDTDGIMLEAKGPGYAWAVKRPESWVREKYDGYAQIMDQAERQSEAAELSGRPVEWHFAEKAAADFFRKEFESKGYKNITVVYTPFKQGAAP